MTSGTAHEFALFIGTSRYTVDQFAQTLCIYDHDIMHRITHVLRLKSGRKIIFFNTSHSYTCTLDEITKKNIICTLEKSGLVVRQTPDMHIMLPVLERDALEDTVYMATVYGALSIQLVATEKSRHTLSEKEYLRLEKMTVAAAEQSKQFFLPCIKKIVTLEHFLQNSHDSYTQSMKMWSDISGKSMLQELAARALPESYLVTVGPEGDFTGDEKELLKKYFVPVKLTDTVLRAKDAASLLMGIVRVKKT